MYQVLSYEQLKTAKLLVYYLVAMITIPIQQYLLYNIFLFQGGVYMPDVSLV